MDNPFTVAIALAITLFALGILILIVKRYKRCPSNKVLVIYGKTTEGTSARCLHGGGAFVWPVIQDYDFLSLDPMQIEIPLRGALSSENIRVNVPSVFTVAIGTQPAVMQNAAERLLGLQPKEIMKQAEDIIFGQLRQSIASMAIEDINRDRDKFLENIHMSLAPELEKIGLVLINVNITDITDESGYIEAIGRKAASEAIQQAEIDVAVQQRHGAIGVAQAEKEREIGVAQAEKEREILVAEARKDREIGTKKADRDKLVSVADLQKQTTIGERTAEFEQQARVKEAEREMRVHVANADATAVEGENLAKIKVAETNAGLHVREAEMFQLAETKRREADAAVREAQYVAEARTAEALAQKIEKEKRAELEAVAKAQKAKQIVDAEAEAEQRRIEAEGEAKAIFAKLEAQARGEYEMLARKAEGLRAIVDSCGGAQQAFQMLMLEQLPQLSETAAKAISNIKFDKVIVWDSPNGDGHSKTAGFLQSMASALPPMLHMMRDIGGVEMPEFLGKLVGDQAAAKTGDVATTAKPPAGDGAADRTKRKDRGGPA